MAITHVLGCIVLLVALYSACVGLACLMYYDRAVYDRWFLPAQMGSRSPRVKLCVGVNALIFSWVFAILGIHLVVS